MVISEKLWDITGGGKNTLNIVQIKERDPELTRDLLDIWESAVRATHLFLPEAEIGRIKQFVPRAFAGGGNGGRNACGFYGRG